MKNNQTADGFSWLRDGKTTRKKSQKSCAATFKVELVQVSRTRATRLDLFLWFDVYFKVGSLAYPTVFFRLQCSFASCFRPPLYRPLCCVSSETDSSFHGLAYRTGSRPSFAPRFNPLWSSCALLNVSRVLSRFYLVRAIFTSRPPAIAIYGRLHSTEKEGITYRRKSHTKAAIPKDFYVHAVDDGTRSATNRVVSMNVADK